MKSKLRSLVISLAAIAAVAAAIFSFRNPHAAANHETAELPSAPSVATSRVRRGIFIEHLSVGGSVGGVSGTVTRLAFRQAGVLQSLNVHVGDHVRRGMSLATEDPTTLRVEQTQALAELAASDARRGQQAKRALAASQYQATLQGRSTAANAAVAAENALAQANVKLAFDRREVARLRQLFAAGVVAEKDLRAAEQQRKLDLLAQHAALSAKDFTRDDQHATLNAERTNLAVSQNDLTIARAQHDAAAARVEAADYALANAMLLAPSDGIITTITKQPGEYVDPATAVVELSALATPIVSLTIPVTKAAQIQAGQSFTLRLADDAEHQYQGKINRVLPTITADGQSRLAEATIDFAQAPIGTRCTASIITNRKRGFIIPASAVVEDPESGATVVFTRVAHRANSAPQFVEHAVTVINRDDRDALISGAVNAGDTIATTGSYTLLSPGGQ